MQDTSAISFVYGTDGKHRAFESLNQCDRLGREDALIFLDILFVKIVVDVHTGCIFSYSVVCVTF